MKYQLPIVRVLTLIALAFSTALLVDHLSSNGAFCGFDGPCGEVADSAYGSVLGVPLSGIGIVWFILVFALTLIPNRRIGRVLQVFATISGLTGITLLVIQIAVLNKICPLCVVVDCTSIALAAIALARRPEPMFERWYWSAAWGWLGLFAVMVPIFWSLISQSATAPEQVREHWVPGRITIVEVTDFDCQACSKADAVMQPILRKRDIHIVRLVAPLPVHVNARPAGRAYLAARRQGKGEEMATLLYMAPLRDPASCRLIAAKMGLDLSAYDRDIQDPAFEAEMDANAEWATRRSSTKGLPLIFIQDEMLVGVPSPELIEEALARAKPYQP